MTENRTMTGTTPKDGPLGFRLMTMMVTGRSSRFWLGPFILNKLCMRGDGELEYEVHLVAPGILGDPTKVFEPEIVEAERAISGASRIDPDPIPMRLPCPACGGLHVDEGEFATRPHHTHACQSCGNVWRPAIVATVGVRFLPGFKNETVNKD